MRPVGLKGAFKRDQVQCGRRIRVCASLENEQIQKQEDIEDTEHDAADHKALAEALPDMRRVPFLMRKKADQDRYGNASNSDAASYRYDAPGAASDQKRNLFHRTRQQRRASRR